MCGEAKSGSPFQGWLVHTHVHKCLHILPVPFTSSRSCPCKCQPEAHD